MKKGNLDKWVDIPKCTNLLLFSQLVRELLFDYSIPSNRVSTLNSHYLCLDALSAIDGIENHGVPEGTLKPIMEELYDSLAKDPAFSDEEIPPVQYFVKNDGDKYLLASNVSSLNYSELKKTALSLSTCFFKKGRYWERIKSKVEAIIVNNDVGCQKDLFRLVKSLLTELMNSGYSLKYIQSVMKQYYWNSGRNITDGSAIHYFFDSFDLKKKTYTVVFIVHKKRMEKLVSYIDDVDMDDTLEIRFMSHSEKQFFAFKKSEGKNTFLPIKTTALDPYAAAEKVKYQIEVDAALYRLYDHNYRYDINSARCGVYSDTRFYYVDNSINAVEHTRPLSNSQITESMKLSSKALSSAVHNRAYEDMISIINAARFHAHSLDSKSEENQLLDMWAIFEAVLDISNEHTGDRIKQVCMYLVPILKRKYIYSLFLQLAQDIRNYDESAFNEITKGREDEYSMVCSICEFVILDSNREAREKFLKKCIDFPLLKERIEYYASELQSSQQVYQYIEKHGLRVKWQIMRIYRNRNLIIHNADTMPYLTLLIENLHAYVDEFLSYAIECLADEHDIESMCQELFIKECQRRALFQKSKNPMTTKLVEEILK